jgi:hypothetical protein
VLGNICKLWIGYIGLLVLCGWLATMTSACTGDACHVYFQELKSRCRLGSSAEGAKLDLFLSQRFSTCQLEICERTSVNEINCLNPDTHIPGGLRDGRFFTCQPDNTSPETALLRK